MKPSEILDGAANIVIRDGWNQGEYYEPSALDGTYSGEGGAEYEVYLAADDEANRSAPCCQAGAISRAAFGVAWLNAPNRPLDVKIARARAEDFMKAYIESSGYISRQYGNASPIAWNDEPTRTAEEVVEALRGAAVLARGAGE